MLSSDAMIEYDKSEVLDEENEIDIDFDIDVSETKTSTICICPKCGKDHKLKIYWTGSGTPRMYCHRCREIVAGISTPAIYESQPNTFRISRSSSVANENQ